VKKDVFYGVEDEKFDEEEEIQELRLKNKR
jgi:hypothetical protein